MDRFIINVFDSIDVGFNSEDINKLEEYLEDNIRQYKNFSKYDNFIVDYPTIQIQIDQNSNYDVISTYYDKIYNKIYNLIDGTNDLKECIINYVTQTQTVEIVDANIKTSSTLKNYEFINCNLEGIFESCAFLGCEITNSQLSKSKVEHTEIDNSKVLACRVDGSSLKNCYFMEGFLNGEMLGGVFRSGELGPYASLDSEVKVVNDHENFFNIKYEEERTKGDKDGKITGFGKSK